MAAPILRRSPDSFALIVLLSLCFGSLVSVASLSTISISDAVDATTLCALTPLPGSNRPPSLNCTRFPGGFRVPLSSPDVSFSGIAGGAGFVTALTTFPSQAASYMLRWTFPAASNGSSRVPYKQIYRGPTIDHLDAGSSRICGHLNEFGILECWQWRRFSTKMVPNVTDLAVGDDFVCVLSGAGRVRCFGGDAGIVGREPGGRNYSAIAAGARHACALSLNGSLDCWGNGSAVEAPAARYASVALGDDRSCGVRFDGTVVCWGDQEFSLPERLEAAQFVTLQGKGRVFCGILANFSVHCWGNRIFESINSSVFDNVLPGPCSSSCPCTLPGSGRVCGGGGSVCQPCVSQVPPPRGASPRQPPPSRHNGLRGKLVALLVVGCVGSISAVAVVCFFAFRYCNGRGCRVHDSGRTEDAEAPPPENSPPSSAVLVRRLSHMFGMENGGSLEEFSLKALLEVTDHFSDSCRIGGGSFGSVYRATLADGREVAIKRAEAAGSPSRLQGEKDKDVAFLNELESLSRLNHLNLVRLLGFCEDGAERVLVYEYMANGSLHDHLHNRESPFAVGSPLLTSWTARLRVALEAARGVEYLHEHAVPVVIHRDIKSANILLDSDWTARVSDFGLSQMGPEPRQDGEEPHLSLSAAGTVGYIDPEYYRLQQLTTKSDVYSFGVVLLEMLCGRRAIHRNEEGMPRNVVDLVVPYVARDEIHRVLDPRPPPPTPYEFEGVACVGYLAADCVMLGGRDRPSMSEVARVLERALTACLASPSPTPPPPPPPPSHSSSPPSPRSSGELAHAL